MHAIISPEAIRDLRGIWLQVAEESEDSADRLIIELVDRALQIGEFPLAAAVMPGREAAQTRRVVVRTWVILYEVRENYVDVLRIVHGGRDLRRLRL